MKQQNISLSYKKSTTNNTIMETIEYIIFKRCTVKNPWRTDGNDRQRIAGKR